MVEEVEAEMIVWREKGTEAVGLVRFISSGRFVLWLGMLRGQNSTRFCRRRRRGEGDLVIRSNEVGWEHGAGGVKVS